MELIKTLAPENSAAIAIDCLNSFLKPWGALSISQYQSQYCGRDLNAVQRELDELIGMTSELRRALFEAGIPQIQFQDAHVVEWIHGKRYHSMEIARQGEEPDFIRTFPPHALLEKNRRFGSEDQRAVDEIRLSGSREVYIRWFDSALPPEASVEPGRELIFLKDDFCMAPGNRFIEKLFWELRRQKRFNLIVFGVCDEFCNIRNVMLMLVSLFNVFYVTECTYPLDPSKREPSITYMSNFNRLSYGRAGRFEQVSFRDILEHFG